jgi:hypothetical protein
MTNADLETIRRAKEEIKALLASNPKALSGLQAVRAYQADVRAKAEAADRALEIAGNATFADFILGWPLDGSAEAAARVA